MRVFLSCCVNMLHDLPLQKFITLKFNELHEPFIILLNFVNKIDSLLPHIFVKFMILCLLLINMFRFNLQMKSDISYRLLH